MILLALLWACARPDPSSTTPSEATAATTADTDSGLTVHDSRPTGLTGDTAPPDDTANTQPVDCGDPVILRIYELGADWDAGDPATLVHGPQGGWHIGFNARATGSRVLTVSADVTLTRTGERLAGDDNTFGMLLDDQDPATCEGELVGILAYIDDIDVDIDVMCGLAGEEVVVGLTLTDPTSGATDRLERTLNTASDPNDPCGSGDTM